MDKDKFYKPNQKDMAVMKKIHHHHMASMNHSTDSPKHKHHIQQVMKHKSQLSKDAQKLLMMGEGTYKVEIEGLPKMYMDTDNPGELRRDLRKIVRKVDMVKNVERVQKSQVRKDLQLKIQGKDDMEEMTMGQGVEVKKTKIGEVPKGIGWSLKKLGKHTGKDHDVWHRVTKPVAQPKIRAGSPMYSSKNESFFFVAEDQIKKDGAKIKKAYAAIATEDMNTITKHLKKQGIDHDHDKGELYVRRQDHRDVMNHLNDLMKKKMIKSKPPVTAEKLDKEDEPFIKNLVKNLRKGSKTHAGQADDLEKAVKEARGVPRKHTKTYSTMNLKKARELMSPAKHRQDGIDRIAKGMGISKAKATKHHDDVMKSYGFKAEDKGRGPTGIAYSLPKGHPDAENPATRQKYPERQTDKYKADYAKNNPLKLSGKFSKNESDDYHYSTGEPLNKKLSPKAQKAKDAQARIDKKFAPGGSYSKGADQIRKVIAKNETLTKEDTDFSKAIDIVRKHSKGSEIRGSGDGTTVTAEHPRGQYASKADRAAHTNMLKDKLKHLKSVKVVHKTYPGSATEQKEAHSTKDILKMFPKPSKFSDKEVKMAKGIAFDKRYKGGDMDGAVRAQNKIKKVLSDHPAVARANRAANESIGPFRRGPKIFQPKPGDSPERTAMIKSVQKSLNKRRERLAKAKKDRQAAWAQGKDFDVTKALGYGPSVKEEKKKKTGLAGKAEKSGMPLGILKTVYNRGMAAWKTGHRKGTTPQQWAHARVNSFITKSSGTWGKADKDLADKVRARKK